MKDSILTMDDVKRPPRLLAPWMRKGSIVMLHARPGMKKTYFALATALAVSNGEPLLGWEPSRKGKVRRVMYLDAEMPFWLLRKRLVQLGAKQGGGSIAFLSREEQLAKGHTMPDLGSREGQDLLEEAIDNMRPDLVVLDSLSALIRSGGAENDREPWLPIEDWLQRLRARKCAVLMVHHQSKSGLQRGTSAREEVCDAIMSLAKVEKSDALKLTFDKLRDHDGPLQASVNLRLAFDDAGVEWRQVSRALKLERDNAQSNDTRDKVMALVERGVNKSEIASRLGVSRVTVHKHIRASKLH